MYVSETSKSRQIFIPYCNGVGLDIGAGGDPVVPWAICLDMPSPYVSYGGTSWRPHLEGCCKFLYWFRDRSLEFIYSSHLLEDFSYGEQIVMLGEWIRVLMPKGKLMLLLPDQQRYVAYAAARGESTNPRHRYADFSLKTFQDNVLSRFDCLKVIDTIENTGDYSFAMILERKYE